MRGFLVVWMCLLTGGLAWAVPRQHLDLVDTHRQRRVPVSLYLPSEPRETPYRLIVFSPGLGGSRDGYSELASYWSNQRGYAVAVLEHVGSNLEAVKTALRAGSSTSEALSSPGEVMGRPRDVSFVLDRLAQRKDIDAKQVGLAGHSYGAYTAMAGAGIPALVHGQKAPVNLGDARVVAAIAMSPQEKGLFFRPEDMKLAKIPLMILTGTRDKLRTGARWQDRAEVFDFLGDGSKFLGVFRGASHLAFAGHGRGAQALLEPLERLTGDFWDSYLRGRGPLTEEQAKHETHGLLEIWRSK